MRNTIPSINIPINNKRSITTSTSMDRILGTNPTLACIPTSSSSNRSLIRRCPLMLLTHRTSRSINMASTRIIIRRRSSSISTNLLQLLISKSINTHHSKLHRHRLRLRLRLRLKSKRRIRWCNNWD
jgi:hypothetical protein